jgi:hypothetical protein
MRVRVPSAETVIVALLALIVTACGPSLRGTVDRDRLEGVVDAEAVVFGQGIPEPAGR